MKTVTASDRSSLIKLASGLPKGDTTRRAILAGLVKTSAPNLVKTSAPKIAPSQHPMVVDGASSFAAFGDSIVSAFKSAAKSPKNVVVRRKEGPSLYRLNMRVLPLHSYEVVFDIVVEYDLRTLPRVTFMQGGSVEQKVSIPTSTGLNPDGTLGLDTTDPGKLIKFLVGYVKENSKGFNIMKGDDAGPLATLKDKHDLINLVFSSFKSVAKSAGAPIDAVTSRSYIERPSPSSDGLVWSLGSGFPRDPATVQTALKAWNAVTAKFSSKLSQAGIIPGYVAPRPAPAPGMDGIGTFTLTIS